MATISPPGGGKIRQTNNLRCLSRHAHDMSPVRRIKIMRTADRKQATVFVYYENGDLGTATFESGAVAREWAVARCQRNPNFLCPEPEDMTVGRDGSYRPTMLTPIG